MNLVSEAASVFAMSASGAGLGYGAAWIFPTVDPKVGAIYGACLAFLAGSARSIGYITKQEIENANKTKNMTCIAKVMGITCATFVLSFVICRSAHLPFELSRCVVFTFQFASFAGLAVLAASKISEFACGVLGTGFYGVFFAREG